VGSDVKTLRVGDEVYGAHVKKPLNALEMPGYCSEFVVTPESYLMIKPRHLSFEEITAVYISALTAYQSIKRGLELMPPGSSLEGKTVFVPGALSATGAPGSQLLKNVYGAKKLIATVSTPKIPLVEEYLPGVFDEIVDYKKQNVVETVGKGTVDFIYNTQWTLTSLFPILKPDSGVVMSIASVPTSDTLRSVIGPDRIPFWLAWIPDLIQLWYAWKLRGTNIKYEFLSGSPSIREDMEHVGEIIATGKIKAVMTVVNLSDINAVREGCQKVISGKGGIGALVIKIV
jgi:NADPH:quinone reductase-like Zn-dependent oxidoreductase